MLIVGLIATLCEVAKLSVSKKLQRFQKSSPDAQFGFKLRPRKNTEVELAEDGNFEISWKSLGKPRHQWFSEDGRSGRVSARHLSRGKNWKTYTGDIEGIGQKYLYGDGLPGRKTAGAEVDNKIIGMMSGKDGENLFLYEQERLKHRNGRVSLKGRLLTSQFVVEHAKELAHAFGAKVVRNHLLVDRGWRDGKTSALENLSRMMSSNVSDDFWDDVARLNKKLSKLQKSSRSERRLHFDQKESSPLEKCKSWTSCMNDATKAVDDAVDDASDWADENIVEPTKDGIDDAAEFTEDLIDNADEFLVKPAEQLLDDAAELAEEGVEFIVDELTQEVTLSSTAVLKEISGQADRVPFHASYDASASVTTDIIFHEGYVGAWDPSTISFRVTPNIYLGANASIELDPLVQSVDFSVEGSTAEYPEDPTGGQIELSGRLDLHFEAAALAGEGVGAGVAVEVSPEATLNVKLDGSMPKFTDVNHNFKYSEDLDRLFDNFDPKVELDATITPVITLTVGPQIPEKVQGVGGMKLATVEIAYLNPILFHYDTTDPTILKGTSSGVLEPGVTVLEQNIPGIPSVDLYKEDFVLNFANI